MHSIHLFNHKSGITAKNSNGDSSMTAFDCAVLLIRFNVATNSKIAIASSGSGNTVRLNVSIVSLRLSHGCRFQ